jgi:hypothetical protein
MTRISRSPEPSLDITNPLANPRPSDRTAEDGEEQLPNDPPPHEQPGTPTPNNPGGPPPHPLGPIEPLP